VPYLIYRKGKELDSGVASINEKTASETGNFVDPGFDLSGSGDGCRNIRTPADRRACPSARSIRIYMSCSFNLFNVTMKKLGIDFTFVRPDATEEELNAAFKDNTKAVFAETISNPCQL